MRSKGDVGGRAVEDGEAVGGGTFLGAGVS